MSVFQWIEFQWMNFSIKQNTYLQFTLSRLSIQKAVSAWLLTKAGWIERNKVSLHAKVVWDFCTWAINQSINQSINQCVLMANSITNIYIYKHIPFSEQFKNSLQYLLTGCS